MAVLDCLHEVAPPFDPTSAVAQIATTFREYGLNEVTGDRYAAEWDPERPLHICDATGQLDGPPSGLGRAGLDLETKLLGKAFDQRHLGGVGRMIGVESSTGETLFAADMRGRQRLLAPDDDRYGDRAAEGAGLPPPASESGACFLRTVPVGKQANRYARNGRASVRTHGQGWA